MKRKSYDAANRTTSAIKGRRHPAQPAFAIKPYPQPAGGRGSTGYFVKVRRTGTFEILAGSLASARKKAERKWPGRVVNVAWNGKG
jgi:hypothetical protein